MLPNIVNGHDVYEDLSYERTLTRDEFEEKVAHILDKLLPPMAECLAVGEVQKDEVARIVLVGGSSRIPKVRAMVKEFFDGAELHTEMDPDESVSVGAAMMAGQLSGQRDELLVVSDVVPMPVGLEMADDEVDIVIKSGTVIPFCKDDEDTLYETYKRDQDRMIINVTQGAS